MSAATSTTAPRRSAEALIFHLRFGRQACADRRLQFFHRGSGVVCIPGGALKTEVQHLVRGDRYKAWAWQPGSMGAAATPDAAFTSLYGRGAARMAPSMVGRVGRPSGVPVPMPGPNPARSAARAPLADEVGEGHVARLPCGLWWCRGISPRAREKARTWVRGAETRPARRWRHASVPCRSSADPR